MRGSRYGVAEEGWPIILLLAFVAIILLLGARPLLAIVPGLLLVIFALKFRDPHRDVSADPMGVLSPVDGSVASIERDDDGLCITLKIKPFAAYMVRSPTEGKVLSAGQERGDHGIRIRTDEGSEVLLRLRGLAWLPPAAATGYGARVGQGQRCGVLRTAREAEVWMPLDAVLAVAPGEEVIAGETVLARFAGNGNDGE